MKKGRKSPIHVTCKPWPFKPRPGERKHKPICRWVCRGPIKAAEFSSRKEPGPYGRPVGYWRAVLHPSTKEKGRWQVSIFDKDGAWGDSIRNTCTEALDAREVYPSEWKLVDVE